MALTLTDDLRQRWELDGFLCICQFHRDTWNLFVKDGSLSAIDLESEK